MRIQKGQWARYLKGEMPGAAVRQRLAEATGRSAEWILTGNEPGPRSITRASTEVSELREAADLLSRLYERQRGGKWEWNLIMDQLRGSDTRAHPNDAHRSA